MKKISKSLYNAIEYANEHLDRKYQVIQNL